MKRFSFLIGVLPVLFVACDGSQARLIESYRAAEFQTSSSSLDRSEVTLSTSFEIGRAYEVTSRRLEYAAVESDAEPPIDEWGQLVQPKFMIVTDPTMVDENGEPIVERRSNGVRRPAHDAEERYLPERGRPGDARGRGRPRLFLSPSRLQPR